MADIIKLDSIKKDPRLGTFDFPKKVKPRLRDLWDQVQVAQRALDAAQGNANSYALGVLDVLEVDRENLVVTMNMVTGNYVVVLPPGAVGEGEVNDADGATQANDGGSGNASDGSASPERAGTASAASDDATATNAQASGQEKGSEGQGVGQDVPQAVGAQGPESANGRERTPLDAGDEARGHLSVVK